MSINKKLHLHRCCFVSSRDKDFLFCVYLCVRVYASLFVEIYTYIKKEIQKKNRKLVQKYADMCLTWPSFGIASTAGTKVERNNHKKMLYCALKVYFIRADIKFPPIIIVSVEIENKKTRKTAAFS